MSPLRRALPLALAIPCVVVAARLALDALALSSADALALDALASAAALALAAASLACFAREPLADRLGLRAGSLGGTRIALAALGVVGLSHAAEATLHLAGLTSPGLVRFDDALAGLGPERIAFPLVAIALGSATGEELFFRGLIQRGAARVIGSGGAIAVTALAFGAAHGDWLHGTAATVLGAYLGAIAARAGSIRPAIAAHVANNAVALLEKAFGVELPTGPVATPAGLLLGLTLACVGLLALRGGPPSARGLQAGAETADERAGR